MAASPIAAMMQVLLASPGLTAITGQRIYAEQALQAEVQPAGGTTLPHVVVRLSGGSRSYTLDGPAGVREARVVVIGFAARMSDADAIAAAVSKSAEDAFSRVVDGQTVTMFAEGVDVSDFVDALKLFRRATEFRLVITG